MKFRNPVLIVARAFIILLVLTASRSPAATIPVEVFGHLPSIENIAISPDGTRLALINTKDDQRFVVVVSLADGKVILSQQVAGVKLRDIEWTDNDNLLLIISTFTHTRGTVGGDLSEHYVIAAYNLHKNSIVNPLLNKPLLQGGEGSITASSEIIGDPAIRKINGQMVVIVPGLSAGLESENASGDLFLMPSLYKFKAGINVASFVVRSQEFNTKWLIDDKGLEFVDHSYSEDDQKWTLKVRVDGKWKKILSEKFSFERPEVLGVSPDGTALWVRYIDDKSEASGLIAVSLKDGTVTRQVPGMEKYSDFVVSKYSPRIIAGIRNDGDALEFFDSKLQEPWDVILSKFDGEHVKFVAASDDFKKIIVQVEGLRDGVSYILFDADSYKFSLLGSMYSGLKKLAEVKQMTYEAKDNYKLDSFVTYPEGPRKNLPVVVFPHGGPESHDTEHFDWWAQAMAAQGYLVVQPNFRGSDNTIGLRNAGFGEWGRKMQTDLSDSVRQLVKDGVADPKRVCIVGASYGGYAALAGATLDSGVYRCAVSVAGISDLDKFRQYIVSSYDRHDSSGTRYFDQYLGVVNSKDAILQKLSPVQYADKVDIPILLIHGKDDSVVPYEQSELMFTALKKANKQVEFVTLKHEDHWLSNSDTRLQMLQATVKFLLENNPPD